MRASIGIPSTDGAIPSAVAMAATILGGDGSFGGGVGGFGRRYVQIGSIPSIRSTNVKSRSSPISAKCSFAIISSSMQSRNAKKMS